LLSRSFKGWNIAVNPIAEKNLSNEPWEFGYAMGISRPLALKATVHRCNFCRENFIAGVEMYGGLGTTLPQWRLGISRQVGLYDFRLASG
jgi:hypothetical protein